MKFGISCDETIAIDHKTQKYFITGGSPFPLIAQMAKYCVDEKHGIGSFDRFQFLAIKDGLNDSIDSQIVTKALAHCGGIVRSAIYAIERNIPMPIEVNIIRIVLNGDTTRDKYVKTIKPLACSVL